MKKLKKMVLLIVCLCLVLTIGVIVFLTTYDVNHAKERIVKEVNQKIPGTVKIGKIHWSWRLRFEAHDFQLLAPDKSSIIQTKEFHVNVSFPSLMAFSPQVTCVIDHPQVQIIKNKSHKYNLFEALGDQMTGSTNKQQEDSSIKFPFALSLSIHEGNLSYRDLVSGFSTSLKPLNVNIKNFNGFSVGSLEVDSSIQLKDPQIFGPFQLEITHVKDNSYRMKGDLSQLKMKTPKKKYDLALIFETVAQYKNQKAVMKPLHMSLNKYKMNSEATLDLFQKTSQVPFWVRAKGMMKEFEWDGLEVQNISWDLKSMRDHYHMTMDMDVYEGKSHVDLKIAQKNNDWTIDFDEKLKNVNLEQVSQKKVKWWPNPLGGRADLALKGSLESVNDWQNKTYADGKLDVRGASLNTMNINKKVLDGIMSVSRQLKTFVPKFNFSPEGSLKKTSAQYQNLNSLVQIKQGQVMLGDLLGLAAKKTGIDFKGNLGVNLFNQKLNGMWTLHDRNHLLKLPKAFFAKSGYAELPLKVAGQLSSPQLNFSLLPPSLAKNAQNYLKSRVKSQLKSKVTDKVNKFLPKGSNKLLDKLIPSF